MAKKVYFACSIRGGGDMSHYKTILASIKEAGGEILSEIFVNDALQFGGSPLPEPAIYDRDIAMIQAADVVIAETSNPSLGVGYELAYAEKLGKPILCLFNESGNKRLSAMVKGNPYNQVALYSDGAVPIDEIKQFLA